MAAGDVNSESGPRWQEEELTSPGSSNLERELSSLKESEELFRLLVESSPVGAYLIQDFKFVYVNPTFAELFGYKPEEIVNRLGPLDLVHPDDRRKVEENVRKRLQGEAETVRYTARGVRKDGTVIVGEIFGQRATFRGRPAAVGSLVDLTEKLRLLESLKESEERYRSMFQSIKDAIVTVDAEAQVVDWNKGAERLFGYAREEILGQPFIRLVSERCRGKLLAAFRRAAESGDVRLLEEFAEIEGVRRDGTEFAAEMSIACWKGREGLRFTGIIRDVTERKEAFARLERLLEEVVFAFSAAVETRDPYTARHQANVAALARAIAAEMGLPEKVVKGVYFGGLLHDVGKLSIPTEILSKPTPLTPTERALVEQHTLKGYEILKRVNFPWPVAEMALQHHERVDGSGYPRGLKGDEIILEARILAVADVVEAISHHRPYRPARGTTQALRELEEHRGVLYDPRVVDACLSLFREKGFRFETEAEV
jgi:PAS domain S-box-containing protein/putative nucleotidyltransferase with HDIG domain